MTKPTDRSIQDQMVANPPRGFWSDLAEIIRDLREYRDLLYQLTLRDIRIRYKQAVMGFGWALFMPTLVVVSGVLVRLVMAQISAIPLDSAGLAGIAVKAIPWAFFVGAIGFATASLTGNHNLVTKVYFPREVLPLSSVFAMGFDTLIASGVMLLVLPVLGVRPSIGLLWVPLLIVLIVLLTAAASLFLSCANLFFRDVKYLVQVFLTFGIFFTPVFYEAAMFGSKGLQIAMLNPLAPLLEGLRLSVVQGHNLAAPLMELTARGQVVQVWFPWHLGYSAAWAVLGVAFTALLFHRSESIFAEFA